MRPCQLSSDRKHSALPEKCPLIPGRRDLTQSFTLDDPVADIRDFLQRVGFVHLRGVLDAVEIDALTSDVDDAVLRPRPDDRSSWGTTVEGREGCNRVNYLNDESPRVAALGADPHFLAIAALGV